MSGRFLVGKAARAALVTVPLTMLMHGASAFANGTAPGAPPPAQRLPSPQAPSGSKAKPPRNDLEPLHMLGAGDLVAVQVFSRPELSTSTYVADDGTLSLPLVGRVTVGGMSPSDAAQRVAAALKKGQFLLDPQVNITVQQARSQQISVLGEVRTPGRYVLDSRTTTFDLLAQSGGLTSEAADAGYLIRKDKKGDVKRFPIDLKNLALNSQGPKDLQLQGGDSLYVPKASHFYIYGEVRLPNRYKLEQGMTLVEAVSLAGGITDRGSERRVEIHRPRGRGKYQVIDASASDLIQAGDVIRVKQRIF